MTRKDRLAMLGKHLPVLTERFVVVHARLSGSMARGTARDDSGLGVLVAFGGPATPEAYFGVQIYLEDLLGSDVDQVTERALRPPFRPHVERDAITVE